MSANDLIPKIYALLDGNDPMGVNQLGRLLNKSPSWVLKVLQSRQGQLVFTQLEDKKWTLASSQFTMEAWPGEPSSTVEKWIADPLNNVPAIMEGMKELKSIAETAQAQHDFLFRLMQHALKKVK